MNRKQTKFIKDIKNKDPKEIARFVCDEGILWEELVRSTPGEFSMVKQKLTLEEIDKIRNGVPEVAVEPPAYTYAEEMPSPTFEPVDESVSDDAADYIAEPDVAPEYPSEQVKVTKMADTSESAKSGGIFSCRGRMGRLAWFGSNLVLNGILAIVETHLADSEMVVLFLIICIPLVWISICINSKRCHDIGWSGWCQLIPLIGFLLLFWPGDKEDNKYGPADND